MSLAWCEQIVHVERYNVSCAWTGVCDQESCTRLHPPVRLGAHELVAFLRRTEYAVGTAVPALVSMHTLHNGSDQEGYTLSMRFRFYQEKDRRYIVALQWICPHHAQNYTSRATGSCA